MPRTSIYVVALALLSLGANAAVASATTAAPRVRKANKARRFKSKAKPKPKAPKLDAKLTAAGKAFATKRGEAVNPNKRHVAKAKWASKGRPAKHPALTRSKSQYMPSHFGLTTKARAPSKATVRGIDKRAVDAHREELSAGMKKKPTDQQVAALVTKRNAAIAKLNADLAAKRGELRKLYDADRRHQAHELEWTAVEKRAGRKVRSRGHVAPGKTPAERERFVQTLINSLAKEGK